MNHLTPEDEFNAIIDAIETRAMACDGPVTPTLQEATEEELSRLWELVNEISPKRKALARKQLKGTANDAECDEYLRQEGIDPEEIGRQGLVFVKTLKDKLHLQRLLLETVMRCNLALPETEEQLKWFDEGCTHQKSGDFYQRIVTALKLGIIPGEMEGKEND